MPDDDYGEAHSIDSDSFLANGSEFGSPVPPSRHEVHSHAHNLNWLVEAHVHSPACDGGYADAQLRSPTRDMVPAAPELDTIEEEDQDAVRAPTPIDQLEASVSVENLEGSMSYTDLTVPVAAAPQPEYVDIITNKLMAEMLQEVADETAQYGDATEVEEPVQEPVPTAQTPKLELTLPDPSSTAELRLSDPTDLGACSARRRDDFVTSHSDFVGVLVMFASCAPLQRIRRTTCTTLSLRTHVRLLKMLLRSPHAVLTNLVCWMFVCLVSSASDSRTPRVGVPHDVRRRFARCARH